MRKTPEKWAHPGMRMVDATAPSVLDMLRALDGVSLDAWLCKYPNMRTRCDGTAEGVLRELARRAATGD